MAKVYCIETCTHSDLGGPEVQYEAGNTYEVEDDLKERLLAFSQFSDPDEEPVAEEEEAEDSEDENDDGGVTVDIDPNAPTEDDEGFAPNGGEPPAYGGMA